METAKDRLKKEMLYRIEQERLERIRQEKLRIQAELE
jgi:hypothetical protein